MMDRFLSCGPISRAQKKPSDSNLGGWVENLTNLVLAVRPPMVRGTYGQDDDHDKQSSAGGQDGYQGFIIRWLLEEQERGWLVPEQRLKKKA